MGIVSYCPNGHRVKVKDYQAGRRGLCPTCGDEAAEFYAEVATDPSRSALVLGAANVGLAFSSLWTSDTWKQTAVTLASAVPIARLVGTFKHFGYAEDAARFANGLREGSFATNRATAIKSGAEAVEKLALPSRSAPPNATYRVTPEWWRYVKGPTRVAPANGQPGGGWEYFFPQGTGPGTVRGPTRIPK